MSGARYEGQRRGDLTWELTPARRRKIIFAVILGREIEPADEPYARDKASRVASRLPHGLFIGLVFGFMAGSSVSSFFPLTPASTAILVFGGACVAVYAACLVAAIRVWWWLRHRS